MFEKILKKLSDLYHKPTLDVYRQRISELEANNVELNRKIDLLIEKLKETKTQNALFINEIKRYKRKDIVAMKPKDSVFDGDKINNIKLNNINTVNKIIKDIKKEDKNGKNN